MTDDISQAEELERRWPRDGDRLFVTTSWAYNAHVVRDPNERAYRLPMGYKRAADLLVERAATDVVDRANVIYPALYCYRQALELLLKGLIDEFGRADRNLRNSNAFFGPGWPERGADIERPSSREAAENCTFDVSHSLRQSTRLIQASTFSSPMPRTLPR